MAPPTSPYQPYAAQHENVNGPGDARPSSLQIMKDAQKVGALENKTILITGCSGGIGAETARALYEGGATLFLTARDMTKLNRVIDDIVQNAQHNRSGPRPQGIEMHLDSLESVRTGAQEFQAKSGHRLNILINNAGVMMCPFSQTRDGFEMQIGTNHFAHFLLFQLLKDDLISSARSSKTNSRVVNVSSVGHRFSGIRFSNKAELEQWNSGQGYDRVQSYGQSKTANIYMANSIARHYADKNVVGISLHPGRIMTGIVRHWQDEEFDQLGASSSDQDRAFKDASQGAATTVWAAISDHFEGKRDGVYLSDVGEAGKATTVPDYVDPGWFEWAYDEEKEEGLWELSLEALSLLGGG